MLENSIDCISAQALPAFVVCATTSFIGMWKKPYHAFSENVIEICLSTALSATAFIGFVLACVQDFDGSVDASAPVTGSFFISDDLLAYLLIGINALVWAFACDLFADAEHFTLRIIHSTAHFQTDNDRAICSFTI